MKNVKLIVLLLSLSIFLLCSCNKNSAQIAKVENKQYGFNNWDKIRDSRFIHFDDYYYQVGPVKHVEVYLHSASNPKLGYVLILTQEYTIDGLKVSDIWTPVKSDGYSTKYIYDENGRIVSVELYNDAGIINPEISRQMKYLEAESGNVTLAREVYQNGNLLQIEKESKIENGFRLEIEGVSLKQKYENIIINGMLVESSMEDTVGNRKIKDIVSFSYNEKSELIKIQEYSSLTDKVFFEYLIENDDKGRPSKVKIIDMRKAAPILYYSYKIMEYDAYGNWIDLEKYDSEGKLIERLKKNIEYH